MTYTRKEIENRIEELETRKFYLDFEMKKIYTEIELDNLIRKYGFENKKVIAYAKRLDKQEKV